jgi:hypothetical protein
MIHGDARQHKAPSIASNLADGVTGSLATAREHARTKGLTKAQGAYCMARWLRYLLIALLIYFVIVSPTEAAIVTRRLFSGAVTLFVGTAESVGSFLRAIIA